MDHWEKEAPPSQEPEPEPQVFKPQRTSGLAHTWRLWRHCCCRYGLYPLIVAPIVTIATMLSMLSSAGCDFLEVDIGFTPANPSVNQSSMEMGLFFYQSGELEENKYREAFVEGCQWFEDDFISEFIDEDRTWKVARIMAYIAGAASLLATTTSWLFVISPLPASFFWPGVLLPALMTAFLAEGSKFLFFDTAICRNTVWFPSGADSLPRVADECSLGTTGLYAIAAGSTFFVALILVCLRAPEQRPLDSQYGTEYEESDLESANGYGRHKGPYGDRRMNQEDSEYYSRNGSVRDDRSEIQYSVDQRRVEKEDFEYRSGTEEDFGESSVARDPDILTKSEERLKALDSKEDKYAPRTSGDEGDEGDEDKYNPKKPSPPAEPEEQTVSESRLHTVERLEQNTNEESKEMIEQFVNDLNDTFDAEANQEEGKKDDLTGDTPGFFDSLCAPATTKSF